MDLYTHTLSNKLISLNIHSFVEKLILGLPSALAVPNSGNVVQGLADVIKI